MVVSKFLKRNFKLSAWHQIIHDRYVKHCKIVVCKYVRKASVFPGPDDNVPFYDFSVTNDYRSENFRG